MSSLIRKALWPAVIAIGFMVFLGAMGHNGIVKTANADHEVLDICGPEIILEGGTYLYVIFVDDDFSLSDTGEDDQLFVDLDDISGDSDLTSRVKYNEEDGEWQYDETDAVDFFSNLDPIPAEELSEEGGSTGDGDVEDVLNDLEDTFDIERMFFNCLDLDDLEDDIHAEIKQKIDDGELCSMDTVTSSVVCGGSDSDGLGDHDFDCLAFIGSSGEDCNYTGDMIDAIVAAIIEGILDDDSCSDIANAAEDAALNEDASAFMGDQVEDAVEDNCEFGWFLNFGNDDLGGFAFVDVTCEEAGEFDLSAYPQGQNEGDGHQITVQCIGEVDDAEIVAEPTTVEIIPALGSTFASLVTLNLLDENGDPSGNGTTVVWTTDRCRLSDDGISIPGRNDDWENQIAEALEVFGDFNRNNAQTAFDINVFVDSLDLTTRTTVEAEAFVMEEDAGDFDEGDVISAVILDCSATNTTPGIAKVTACIDVDGADICKTVNVTVVGPPVAPLVLTTDQTNVRCGERVQITATIKDAAGQNVSDHTRVEVATNAGGVLGGTGAIAAQAGLVSPVSSTVGETVNGVATFWLITSELHQGTYTVLVTTGGGGAVASGGLFSTAPVSGAVTVTCGAPTTTAPSAPSPAATVRAPSTGQGIVPPSTGDAGLADASGSSWALFVIAGLTVFALAGVASIKFARR